MKLRSAWRIVDIKFGDTLKVSNANYHYYKNNLNPNTYRLERIFILK